MKDQVEDLTRLGLIVFAIGLGDEKGERTFNRVSNSIAFRWMGSPVSDRAAVGSLKLFRACNVTAPLALMTVITQFLLLDN